METVNYEKQGTDFLKETGTDFKAYFVGNRKYFTDDKESRDVYRITLTRGNSLFTFLFGQSIAKSGSEKRIVPTHYDVLSCLTKNDPLDFENFCREYGYNSDSKKDKKIYLAVKKEWDNVNRFFNFNEIEKMQDIQ